MHIIDWVFMSLGGILFYFVWVFRGIIIWGLGGSVFFFFHTTQHEALLQPGIKSEPPAVEAQSLNHWTTRVVLDHFR